MRNAKPKKYCSKKCANIFHHNKNYQKKNLDWGTRGPKAKADKERRKAILKEYEQNHYTAAQVAKILNMTHASGVFHRAKILGIEPLIIKSSGKKSFFTAAHVEQIKNEYAETPIPAGYLTAGQAAEYLGWAIGTFSGMFGGDGHIKHDIGPPQRIEWQQTHGQRNTCFLYTKEDLDEWAGKLTALRKEKKQRRHQACAQKQAQKQAETEQRKQQYHDETKNLISIDQAAIKLGYKSQSPIYRIAEKLNLTIIDTKYTTAWGPQKHLSPNDVEKLAQYIEEEKQLQLEENKAKKAWKFREDDWKSAENYEKKEFLTNASYINDPRKQSIAGKSILANEHYAKQAEQGNIIQLNCKVCMQDKPYAEFHRDGTYQRGRRNDCKICVNERGRRWQRENKKQVDKSKSGFWRRLIGGTIKKDLSKNRKKYAKELSIANIWEKVVQYCGYDEHQLVDHLQSQFNEYMSWDNHGQRGTTRKKGEYCWNIDHIIPRSSFHFTRLDDPQFIECWSLSNLRPLEESENRAKGVS
jgi:hypothetical protein